MIFQGFEMRLITAIWLLLAVFSPVCVFALTAPEIKSLGQLNTTHADISKIAFDGAGNLYLDAPQIQSIVKIDMYGEELGRFSVPSSGAGLAVSEDGSRIYVSTIDAVVVLDGVEGKPLGTLGRGQGEFGAAGDIALDGQGYVFVVDTKTLEVKTYDLEGAFVSSFGGRGKGAGKFLSIWDMAINPATRAVYVADIFNSRDEYDPSGNLIARGARPRVQVFSLGGEYIRTLDAGVDFGLPALTFFSGIEFDDKGRAFILDSHRGEIRALSLPQTFLARYAGQGFEPGQLMRPSDSAFDPLTKRLFVLCQFGRIEIFGIDGGQTPVKLNASPSRPLPLAPLSGDDVAGSSVDFEFRNAVDTDSPVLSYDLQLSRLGETLRTEQHIDEGAVNTSHRLSYPYVENAGYQWQVRASDGASASGWSGQVSFYYNNVDEPPVATELLFPLEGEVIDGKALLSWSVAADPDPNDLVRYRIEIASEPDFASLVLRQDLPSVSVELGALSDYLALQDGQGYFWRVTAIDNHDLASPVSAAGRFFYDTSLLELSANMPDVRFYAGGNHAHPGRYLGDSPLELRDLEPGVFSLVAERSGFETRIGQVSIGQGENSSLHIELLPALIPVASGAVRIQSELGEIEVMGGASPFVVDFDNDGIQDLLVGDAAGWVHLFRGEPEGVYAAGELLSLPAIAGATPFVYDWNGDGRKDLLVGTLDGTVWLFLNHGTEAEPVFAVGIFLQAEGVPLDVGERALPEVVESFGSRGPGLLVGAQSGEIFYYGFASSAEGIDLLPGEIVHEGIEAASVFPVDWDADGRRELMLQDGDAFVFHEVTDEGLVPFARMLLPAEVTASGGRLSVFAFDADGAGGKDLYLGDGIGRLWLLPMEGVVYLPAFGEALQDKILELEDLSLALEVDISFELQQLSALIEDNELSGAWELARELVAHLTQGGELVVKMEELVTLLR